MRPLFRALALLTLLALTAAALYAGIPEAAALLLLGAGLGGVAARPKAAKKFRPDTWRPARDG